LGTRGAGVTSTSCPMMDASIRLTPRMDAPRNTMEYSISQSAMTQSSATEVNGPHDARAAHLRAVLDHHTADEIASRIDHTAVPRLDGLQHHAVDLEHVSDVAGVLPVSRDGRGGNLPAVVDEPLDGFGDLHLATP
jgi:hypothetical protein